MEASRHYNPMPLGDARSYIGLAPPRASGFVLAQQGEQGICGHADPTLSQRKGPPRITLRSAVADKH